MYFFLSLFSVSESLIVHHIPWNLLSSVSDVSPLFAWSFSSLIGFWSFSSCCLMFSFQQPHLIPLLAPMRCEGCNVRYSFVGFPIRKCQLCITFLVLSSVYSSVSDVILLCYRLKFLCCFLSSTLPFYSAYEVRGVWCTLYFRCFPYPKVSTVHHIPWNLSLADVRFIRTTVYQLPPVRQGDVDAVCFILLFQVEQFHITSFRRHYSTYECGNPCRPLRRLQMFDGLRSND